MRRHLDVVITRIPTGITRIPSARALQTTLATHPVQAVLLGLRLDHSRHTTILPQIVTQPKLLRPIVLTTEVASL